MDTCLRIHQHRHLQRLQAIDGEVLNGKNPGRVPEHVALVLTPGGVEGTAGADPLARFRSGASEDADQPVIASVEIAETQRPLDLPETGRVKENVNGCFAGIAGT